MFRRSLALVCEVCGADLLAGRDDRPMVLDHLRAIAELHYQQVHPERVLGAEFGQGLGVAEDDDA